MKFLITFIVLFTLNLPTGGSAVNKRDARDDSFSIATFNIRNYGSLFKNRRSPNTNKKVLKRLIKQIKGDLIGLQEIVGTKDFDKFIRKHFPGYKTAFSECGGTGRQKVGFLYNSRKLELEHVHEDLSIKVRDCHQGLRPMLIGHFRNIKTKKQFLGMVVHLKAGGTDRNISVRQRQLNAISDVIDRHRDKGYNDIILLGDFNTTEYNTRNAHYIHFIEFLERNGLINLSADVGCSYYWSGGIRDGVYYPAMLDHILVSSTIDRQFTNQETAAISHCRRAACQKVNRKKLGVSFREVSDHCPVVASLKK